MAAVLNTNMASLYAQKNLSTAQTSLAESVQRLSSGSRINSAKDDAAGYGISQSITGTKNVVDQNIRNAQNGISWAQTAEGALDVVGKILQRALSLSTQKLDASLNATQIASITSELTALQSEVNSIAVRTKFQGGSATTSVFGSNKLDANGLPALAATDNTGATLSATGAFLRKVVGGVTTWVNDASHTAVRSSSLSVDTGSGTSTSITAQIIDPANFTAGTDAARIAAIETLIATNGTNRSNLGEKINALEYAVDNMQTLSNNLSDGISRIVDTDYAKETANLTRTQILQQAATAMLTQANQMPNVILTLLK